MLTPKLNNLSDVPQEKVWDKAAFYFGKIKGDTLNKTIFKYSGNGEVSKYSNNVPKVKGSCTCLLAEWDVKNNFLKIEFVPDKNPSGVDRFDIKQAQIWMIEDGVEVEYKFSISATITF